MHGLAVDVIAGLLMLLRPPILVLYLQDNGVGMSRDELVKNLGTIARSGSLEFLKSAGPEASKDIIGQVCSRVYPRT